MFSPPLFPIILIHRVHEDGHADFCCDSTISHQSSLLDQLVAETPPSTERLSEGFAQRIISQLDDNCDCTHSTPSAYQILRSMNTPCCHIEIPCICVSGTVT